MTQMEQDIKMVELLIKGEKIPKDQIDKYHPIYPIQTENSRKLFPILSHQWENSIWIGGSGDQPINGILYGSRNLTIIDKNPLAIHYILFKLAALQALPYEEFLDLFSWHKKQSTSLQEQFEEMKPFFHTNNIYWERDSRKLWQEIIDNYSKQEIARNLFYQEANEFEQKYEKEHMLIKNPYLEKKFYNYLKRAIKRTRIHLYTQDIQNIHLIPISYPIDKIYLSNVFLEMELSLEQYQAFLQEQIYPYLAKNGEAMVGYLNISHLHGASLGKLGTTDQIVSFFKEHEYQTPLILEDQFQKQINSAFIYQKK
ncbi:MAG: DUF3419 family protein [Bacilli bacterium]|nr:DUF3419 family protein [Bacilli bacterium]